MYWHLAAYNESVAQLTDTDINAVQDGILTVRNSHLIFTSPMDLLAAFACGSLTDRVRFGNAGMTQRGQPHIWPHEQSATIPDLPQFKDMREYPMALPMNEELTVLATTNAAGPSDVNAVLWLGDPGWNANLPNALDRLTVRATVVIAAGAESAWTNPVEVVFERDLWNGVYSVIGANVVAANAIAFRLQFIDQPQVQMKQFRPGGLVQDTIALAPNHRLMEGWGEWGRFHTFNPPLVQTLDDTAGGTYEVRLDLLYLGEGRENLSR